MRITALLIIMLAISVVSVPAQPPGPPPNHGQHAGPPPPPSPPPPSPGHDMNRRAAWKKYMKENPEEARRIMRICRERPELGCGPQGNGGKFGKGRDRRGKMGPDGRPGRPDGMDALRPQRKMSPEFMAKKKKMRKLRNEVKELGEKHQKAESAAEKKRIENKLRKKLDELYNLKLDMMRIRVKDVEEKLKGVKTELAKYEKDRKGVINSWFEHITGQARYKKF